MAQYPNMYNVELTKGPAVVQLEQMFLGDVKANRIGAIVTENGEAVTLGGTCSGTAILSNGGTVSISGTVNGNTCYIDLPSGVYAVEGPVEIFVTNVSEGKTITLVAAFGNVRRTQTGTVIDPGTIIPSVSALIDSIDAAVASIPADYTALLATVAPTFSSSTAYTAGRYVWHSGNLYRFTADHAAGAWAGTDAVQVVVTNEIADLKSALEALATGTAQIGMGFVQGVRYPGAPSVVSTSSTRCASQRAISVGAKDIIEVTIPSGLKVGVVTTLGTSSDWKTSTYTFTATAACDIYLNVAKTSDGGVTPSEITGIVINYTDNSSRVSILEEDDEWLTDAVNRLGVIAPIESPGYINGSGGISAQSSTKLEVYTDKIPVSMGDKITIKLRYTASHELWVVYAIYKADESYITRVTLVNGTSANYYEETVTITNTNAQYIAFSYRSYGDVTATIIKENTTAEKLGSPFATIIPADSVTYPTIDTTAKTLTIPNGTIIIDSRLSSGYVAISPNQTCDYSSMTSTALLFAWDIANSTIAVFAYNASLDLTKYIPLCSLRTSKGLVGSTIPIMVDGQLYGKVNLDHINQGSLWANDNVKGVNHRGYNTVAPENTIPAFKLSKDMGFSFVETDIRFTSDGVPVLLHDATINRTARNSDGTEISDTINIADITYAEASAYDYGIWKGTAYAGTPIPTFTQFLKACRRLGVRPYIELKAGTQAQVEGLVDTAISCGFKGLCTWISYSDTYLSYVKNHASSEKLGLIADTYSSALITTINGLKTADNRVHLSMTVLGNVSDAAVAELITADIPLECFINGNYSVVGAKPYITSIITDADNVGKDMYTLWSHNIYT